MCIRDSTRVTLKLGDRNAGETVRLTPPGLPVEVPVPVSYTHLDVYKRQG